MRDVYCQNLIVADSLITQSIALPSVFSLEKVLQNDCHRETGHCFFSFPSFANATRNSLRGIIGRHETFFGGTFQMQSSETCVMECAKKALVCRALNS